MNELSPVLDSKSTEAKTMVQGALALVKAGAIDAAFDLACLVLEKDPKNVLGHNVCGIGLRHDRDLETAIDAFKTALEFDPSDVYAKCNLAACYNDMGRTMDAADIYREVLAGKPDYDQASMGLLVSDLTGANFPGAWELHRNRAKHATFMKQVSHYDLPEWDGSTRLVPGGILRWMRKQRVFVVAEEGPGERIMFSALLKNMVDSGVTPVVEVDFHPSLAPLFKRSFPGIEVALRGDVVQADSKVLIGDLCKLYRPTLDHFPQHMGYLEPDWARVRQLRNMLPANKPVIGLSWKSMGNVIGQYKSIPLHAFTPLIWTPDATFVNLQYAATPAEENTFGLTTLPGVDLKDNFDDLAALISACDLVVSVSNSVAHLAGALGVRVWNLIPGAYGRNWFWFLDREDSPWYPSMKLYRQDWRYGWTPLLERVVRDLRGFINERHGDGPRGP